MSFFAPASSLARGTKVAERIARQIVQDVVSRQLAPGTRLQPESAMLEQYVVSRSSLREALRILEVNGLIVMRSGPNGGPVVGAVDASHFGRTLSLFLEMSNATLGDLMAARVTIEPLMARLAAEQRHPGRLNELQSSLEEHHTLDVSDTRAYVRVVQNFHGVIAGLSGNPVLDLFGRGLKEIAVDRILASHQPAARWQSVKREHEEVAKAILAGEAKHAEELMRVHMEKFAASFWRRYGALRDEVIGWQ